MNTNDPAADAWRRLLAQTAPRRPPSVRKTFATGPLPKRTPGASYRMNPPGPRKDT
ncbi:hypothetical protein GCM10007079_33060 [Nocardiopsis terrae]|uniref:Uncharacterized protein n=1 Tax=Nocardiopsis terrae TaxID=372655 RepID=A0ABR9HJD0_9ACTN|nr:hypothetical protein [Nocardiopsis terrae]GHC88254.1 hypothetical protein GCM10007079_33060 [Nocardiopsis terrae]